VNKGKIDDYFLFNSMIEFIDYNPDDFLMLTHKVLGTTRAYRTKFHLGPDGEVFVKRLLMINLQYVEKVTKDPFRWALAKDVLNMLLSFEFQSREVKKALASLLEVLEFQMIPKGVDCLYVKKLMFMEDGDFRIFMKDEITWADVSLVDKVKHWYSGSGLEDELS
jgi:hypothetical protein